MSENESHGQSEPTPEETNPSPGFQLRPPDGHRSARGGMSPFDSSGETHPDRIEIEDLAAAIVVEPAEPPAPQEYEPAPVSESNGHYKPFANPDTPRDRELGIFEHLAELRIRLLWSFFYVGIGMAITWHYGTQLQNWFIHPILAALKANNMDNQLVNVKPTGALQAYFTFSMVTGIILAMPFILFQIWRFVEPALTNQERRQSLIMVPFSITLFILGCALGFWCSPLFFNFFLIWAPQGTIQMWDLMESVTLLAKMLLCFGVCFQVPVVIIFLNKLGLVNRNILIEYWRHAVVLIFVVVAVITPTWDPLTMTICATPPCILYVLSIWMIKWL